MHLRDAFQPLDTSGNNRDRQFRPEFAFTRLTKPSRSDERKISPIKAIEIKSFSDG